MLHLLHPRNPLGLMVSPLLLQHRHLLLLPHRNLHRRPPHRQRALRPHLRRFQLKYPHRFRPRFQVRFQPRPRRKPLRPYLHKFQLRLKLPPRRKHPPLHPPSPHSLQNRLQSRQISSATCLARLRAMWWGCPKRQKLALVALMPPRKNPCGLWYMWTSRVIRLRSPLIRKK